VLEATCRVARESKSKAWSRSRLGRAGDEAREGGGRVGQHTQFGGQRAAGRFSTPRGETLLLLSPRHSKTFKRARGHRGPRGIGSGCEINSAREENATKTVLNINRAQGCCPWSPSREGALDQSSSACRGLPSKGEARALHHQPAPALTLTTPCFCSLSPQVVSNTIEN